MKVLDRVLSICYSVLFRKDRDKDKDILALLDFGSKVNAINPTYAGISRSHSENN